MPASLIIREIQIKTIMRPHSSRMVMIHKTKDNRAEQGVHTYNPSTQETEAGGLQVQDKPGPYSKIQSQKINSNNKR
jgi:hypothetical protein